LTFQSTEFANAVTAITVVGLFFFNCLNPSA
jgi:hypothetical protein